MTLPNFSVLLLAWDDADPSVAVLGGTALPPTLPLVYQLAAHQPVVAVYPHLPPPEEAAAEPEEANESEPKAPESAIEAKETPDAEEEAIPDILTTDTATPGLRLLPGPANTAAAGEPAVLPLLSRIIGLEELPVPSATVAAAASGPLAKTPAATAQALARNQWPAGTSAGPSARLQSPAAPYVGASPVPQPQSAALHPYSAPRSLPAPPPLLVPVPPAIPGQTVREAADLSKAIALPSVPVLAASAAAQLANLNLEASGLLFDPDPELPPTLLRGEDMDEFQADEPGVAEAADLAAPLDDITLDAPAVSRSLPKPVDAEPTESQTAPEPSVISPALDGLNSRMIHYARQAARLVRDRTYFGVIYAPTWPAWLAALEIRNSTGQPLVLYAAGLAIDFLSPAERGWLQEVERMTLRRARLILVPNEEVRRRLLAQYGGAIGEVRIVAAADEATVQSVLSEVAIG